jgi:DeoR/GlpR family transcriptional regulator of sugar metabolism
MQESSTPEERQAHVLAALAERGRITTAELSARFAISEDTARRDFREMAAAGKIQRVHGAALPASPAAMPFTRRYRISADEKVRLAWRAIDLVAPGQVVLIDGGTTNLELARNLPRDLAATIITNSPRIAVETSEHPFLEVILLGGVFHKPSQMTLGARVLEEISQIRADLCFIGVHGLHAEYGLTTAGYDEARIKLAMMKASAEVVALATTSKFGTVAPHRFAAIGDLDMLVAEESAAARDFASTVGIENRLIFT